MTRSQLIAACRKLSPVGQSWCVAVDHWHHEYTVTFSPPREIMEWIISRHINGRCERFSAATAEAVLHLAFPELVSLEEQMVLADTPDTPDVQEA